MKLWQLWRRADGSDQYGEMVAMIVRAPTEEMARELAQGAANDHGRGDMIGPYRRTRRHTWLDKNKSYCDELTSDGEAEVIVHKVLCNYRHD
jgi:hypothetical protein